MALKIPRKVPRYKLNVKGAPWTIYIVSEEQFKKMHPEIEIRLCGLSDGNTHSIFIINSFPKSVMLQTLFHELGHAMLTDLDAVKKPVKDDMLIPEELAVEAIAIGWVELLTHLNLLLDFMDKNSKDVEDVDE